MGYDSMTDLVAAVLLDVHSIDVAKISASTWNTIRDRIIRTANRKGSDIWNARDWTYRYLEGTGTFDTTGSCEIDASRNWANEGRDGVLSLVDGNQKILTWCRAGELRRRRIVESTRRGRPEWYAMSNTGDTPGSRFLLCHPIPSSAADFNYAVLGSAPVLTYDDPGGIDMLIPNPDFRSLLYEMVAADEYRKKGNRIDQKDAEKRAAAGLFAMICTEAQGQPEIQNMPRFGGSADIAPGSDWQ